MCFGVVAMVASLIPLAGLFSSLLNGMVMPKEMPIGLDEPEEVSWL